MGDPTINGSDLAGIHVTAFMPKQSRAVTAPCSRCSSKAVARPVAAHAIARSAKRQWSCEPGEVQTLYEMRPVVLASIDATG